MRTDFNAHLADNEESIGALVNDLHLIYWRCGYKILKPALWKLTKAVTSCKYEEDLKIRGCAEIVETFKELVKVAWKTLDNFKKKGYSHPSFELKWIDNPYKQKEKHKDDDYEKRNSPIAAYGTDLSSLTKEEARNFTLGLQSFFSELNVISWLDLLDKWKEYAESGRSIATDGWDETPLDTYEQLLKLIELTYLAENFYYNHLYEEGMPHNAHLFENDYITVQLNAHVGTNYNPLALINRIMANYNPSILKEEINDWFNCAIEQDKVWNKAEPGVLIDIHNHVVALLECGWLLTQGAEMPEYWLNPDCFEYFMEPKLEEEGVVLKKHHLTDKQFKQPHQALSKIYHSAGVGHDREVLQKLLRYALGTKSEIDDRYTDLRKKLFQIVDVLYLINLEVCSKPN